MDKGTAAAGQTPGGELKKLVEQYKLSVRATAIELGENPIGLKSVIDDKKKISVELALKLEKVFGKPAKFWTDLQTSYDLSAAKGKASLQKKIAAMKKADQIESGRGKAAGKTAAKKAPAKKGPAKASGVKKAAAQKAPGKRGPAKKTGSSN
jgi:addiction module HigA family antidote